MLIAYKHTRSPSRQKLTFCQQHSIFLRRIPPHRKCMHLHVLSKPFECHIELIGMKMKIKIKINKQANEYQRQKKAATARNEMK